MLKPPWTSCTNDSSLIKLLHSWMLDYCFFLAVTECSFLTSRVSESCWFCLLSPLKFNCIDNCYMREVVLAQGSINLMLYLTCFLFSQNWRDLFTVCSLSLGEYLMWLLWRLRSSEDKLGLLLVKSLLLVMLFVRCKIFPSMINQWSVFHHSWVYQSLYSFHESDLLCVV